MITFASAKAETPSYKKQGRSCDIPAIVSIICIPIVVVGGIINQQSFASPPMNRPPNSNGIVFPLPWMNDVINFNANYRISDMIPVALPPREPAMALKISLHTLYSTIILCIVKYICTLSGWGINSCNEPSQIINNWSLVLQYILEVEYLYLLQ